MLILSDRLIPSWLKAPPSSGLLVPERVQLEELATGPATKPPGTGPKNWKTTHLTPRIHPKAERRGKWTKQESSAQIASSDWVPGADQAESLL